MNVDLEPEKVSEILTDIGLEIEKLELVQSIKGGLEGLVIGEVLSKEKHPDADRLNITHVNVGNETPQQIVCGAPNVDAGQKVVVALPGTTIYPTDGESFQIKKAKIRGVESLGMICAEDEIGLGNGHDGIMVLKEDAPVGTLAKSYFDLESDYVFEIGLTPNRTDAMGHLGVARDLLAALKYQGLLPASEQLNWPDVSGFSQCNDRTMDITVEDTAACPRYAGVCISNVSVGESPDWLKTSLKAIGLSPINNVVDITNYVLHEYAQPLHAFDADKIEGGKVVVRKLDQGAKFTTLDGTERTLDSEDLMICDANKGMCIAGVFGGQESGVSDQTSNIFLESAYFHPVGVRKSAKRHGLNTDASFRFERGIDPNITVEALKRAAMLICEVTGGSISSTLTDLYPNKIEHHTFDIRTNRINSLCGINLSNEEIKNILTLLEITIVKESGNVFTINVPPYRVDVTREADIAEEILRIYGFNNVELPSKLNSSLSHRPEIDIEGLQLLISEWLVSNGYTEGMSNSLTKDAYIGLSDALNEEHNVAILNPLSTDLNVLRQSLLFNGMEAVRYNQNHGNEDIKLYEFGSIYRKFNETFNEEKQLAIYLSGKSNPERWNSDSNSATFYHLKGLTESLFDRLGVRKKEKIKPGVSSLFADGLSYSYSKKKVAEIGWVSNKIKKEFGLKNDVFCAIINWDTVVELSKSGQVKFSELSKTQPVTRDFSLLLDESITYKEIVDLAKNANQDLLKSVDLFDVYKGKNLPENKKSYAIRFVLHNPEKTLEDKEIDAVMGKIQKVLTEKLSAELR